jgi:hypothetical protein
MHAEINAEILREYDSFWMAKLDLQSKGLENIQAKVAMNKREAFFSIEELFLGLVLNKEQ